MAPITMRALPLLLAAATMELGCTHLPASRAPTDPGRVECRGDADQVRAIGSFDGWGVGVLLSREAKGIFAGRVRLPPGRSQVACERRSPGGAISTEPPLNAPEVEDDGWGGHNGAFEVAGSGSSRGVGSKQP